MKTIQCAHPPHHHNRFVATYGCGQDMSPIDSLFLEHPVSLSREFKMSSHYMIYIGKIDMSYIYIVSKNPGQRNSSRF